MESSLKQKIILLLETSVEHLETIDELHDLCYNNLQKAVRRQLQIPNEMDLAVKHNDLLKFEELYKESGEVFKQAHLWKEMCDKLNEKHGSHRLSLAKKVLYLSAEATSN